MTPIDFLTLARELSSGNEAALRTSISRAYYADFHQEQITAPKYTFKQNLESVSSHQDVIDFLAGFGERDYKTVAIYLKRARRLRKKADYQLSDTITAQDAQTCIQYAKQVFKLCL